MSRTLVVIAHPDLAKSRINLAWFNAVSEVSGVTVHNLYSRYGDSKIDVAFEQRLLEQYDRVVLQFPLQWYSCPALLKQWIDDVFADGWAYGKGGHALEGKCFSIAVSTWSRETDYQNEGRYRRTIEELTSPFEVIALRVGMVYRPGFFLHGIWDVTDSELEASAVKYRRFVTETL